MASTAWSLLMLLLVLALIPVVLLALKKMQTFTPAGGARALEIAGQLPLGARERVVLVRLQDRVLVLGVTPQQVSLLAEASAADLPQPRAGDKPAFAGMLRDVVAGYTGKRP